MWDNQWRNKIWEKISGPWDIIVVGGGITGAGILREATRLGMHALLVEQRDFAWGTSSRSSKLVHGGLRYLKEGKLGLTRDSVHEREQLLQEGPGLIDPLGFLLTVYKGDSPGRWTYTMGLTVYDLLALRWDHSYFSPQDFRLLAPHISQEGLQGGFRFGDAQTDDARLTLRVILEAVADGATAINYVHADQLITGDDGIEGITLVDVIQDRRITAYSSVVVNATGVWTDRLKTQVGEASHVRPLRGSHLIFPNWRLPVSQAVSFLHPFDQRPVFIFPWEGVTLVGTTDVDHQESIGNEPSISPDEVAYLMAAVDYQFPSMDISLGDVISTYSGVRPVISRGKVDPSEESRDHFVWEDNGLFTVTGGKLTTFRLIALDVLRSIRHHFPELPELKHNMPVLNPVDQEIPGCTGMKEACRKRLLGRYGADAALLVKSAQPGEMEKISGTDYLWAELRWATRSEGVCHLDDLLLRRTRLGIILPYGAKAILPVVKQICQTELFWSEEQWQKEVVSYQVLIDESYCLPAHASIPEWKNLLSEAIEKRKYTVRKSQRMLVRKNSLTAGIILVGAVIITILWKKYHNKRNFESSPKDKQELRLLTTSSQ